MKKWIRNLLQKRGTNINYYNLYGNITQNKNNLDFLITDVDKIITFLQDPKHHLDKQKALYSPIVKFIYYLPFDITTIDEAYRKYKLFLDSLAKHAVYAERNDEYYKGYNYVTLRNRLHEIMKKEPNNLYRLIISL